MIQHTRGDTFDFSGPLGLTINGVATPDLTGWTGRSMVRLLDATLVAELEFSWVDATRSIARIRHNGTASWPLGKARVDIQLTSPSGDIVSTKPTLFEITTDVTYDG
jgi:type IV secretory pathway protease TraF